MPSRGGGDAWDTTLCLVRALTNVLKPVFTHSPVSTQTLFLLFPYQKRAPEFQQVNHPCESHRISES